MMMDVHQKKHIIGCDLSHEYIKHRKGEFWIKTFPQYNEQKGVVEVIITRFTFLI